MATRLRRTAARSALVLQSLSSSATLLVHISSAFAVYPVWLNSRLASSRRVHAARTRAAGSPPVPAWLLRRVPGSGEA